MEKNFKQLFIAVPVLLFLGIAVISFKSINAGNRSITGGGIANGSIHFSLNAIEKANGTAVGHVIYDGEYYNVVCVDWGAHSVIIYADGTSKQAFLAGDNGEGRETGDPDFISRPLNWDDCGDLQRSDFFNDNVTSGNIQLH